MRAVALLLAWDVGLIASSRPPRAPQTLERTALGGAVDAMRARERRAFEACAASWPAGSYVVFTVLDAAYAPLLPAWDARVGALGWAQRAIVCLDAACARAADRARLARGGSCVLRYYSAAAEDGGSAGGAGAPRRLADLPSLTGLAKFDVAHWAVTAHAGGGGGGGGGGGRDGGLKCVCSEMDVAWLADPSAQLAVEPALLETGLAGMADVVLPTNVELRTFNIGFWVAWPSPGVAGFLRNVTAWWAAALAATPDALRDAGGARLADQREFNRWLRVARCADGCLGRRPGRRAGASSALPWGLLNPLLFAHSKPYAWRVEPRRRGARALAPLVFHFTWCRHDDRLARLRRLYAGNATVALVDASPRPRSAANERDSCPEAVGD